jgi:succinate dehydrogenase / fumarate reductase, cytochrome b subunit
MPSHSPRTVSSLNLLRIRFPVGAIASISHRISGALLVLGLPFVVEAFTLSLSSETGYDALSSLTRNPLFLFVLAVPCWAVVQHVLAGIRHLLMDVDLGSTLHAARRSAWLVLAGGIAGAAALLWGLAP